MSLKERLVAEIAETGPLTVAQYMTRCLHDPLEGYYATRPAIGPGGDFITAPQVSQMFGELIGLWLVETWRAMGAPSPVRLVEAGPGDGTLIGDILRAGKLAPDFLPACDLWLVEVSAPLRAQQEAALARAPLTPQWAASLDEVPGGAPILLVANELLDCLPARQFQQAGDRWVERMVGLGPDGELAFALAAPADADGMVLEISTAQEAFGQALGQRIARDGGAALLIDYGRDEPGFGDTFQALSRHGKVDPLAEPGEADLTVHADFPAVLGAARSEGCATAVTTQGQFLLRLGLVARAAALAKARPDRSDRLQRQLERLAAPDQMGQLFKAAAIWREEDPEPPGFRDAPPERGA